MAKRFYLRIGVLSVCCAGVLGGSVGRAATVQPMENPEDEVCIPQATIDEVMTCPADLRMGRKRAVSGVKVGTSSSVKKAVKTEVPIVPGLGRDYTSDLIESMFAKTRKRKKINILKKELQLLSRLARDTPDDDPEKADVLKRLADSHKNFFEQYNYMARMLDEKIFQAKKKGDKRSAAKYKAQQEKLESMARDSRQAAIKAYAEIFNNFPEYKFFDEILFAIGYEIDQLALELESEEEKSAFKERSRMYYQELIRNFPRSRFVPNAWMAYGEYYFYEAKDAMRAQRSYEKVMEWGDEGNPHYVVSMYYIAWCLFNMQEFEKTLRQFTRIIKYGENHPNNPDATAVAKRSRLELVDAFSRIREPKEAWPFFQKIGADLAHRMLVKLAGIYYDKGQWADAITVYRKLEELELANHQNNNGDDLCAYQHKISNAFINSRPKTEQLGQLKRQLEFYRKFSTEGDHDPLKVKQCAADSSSMVWDLATQWHVEAVGSDSSPGTKDHTTMKVAAELYETILSSFPNLDELQIAGFNDETKPNRYRVMYYIADLYWTMERWDKCGPAFDAVAEMNPKGDLTPDAAYGAVLCYNKVYEKERGKQDKIRKQSLKAQARAKKKCVSRKCQRCKRQCKGSDRSKCEMECEAQDRVVLQPRELNEVEQGILRSYTRYVCVVKDSDDLVNIKYRRARIFYEANQFAPASVLFNDLVTSHPTHELAVISANLYLDSLNALGDLIETPRPSCYDNLADSVDVFIDTAKAPGRHLMEDEAFAGALKGLKVGVMRKKAESLNTRKRFKSAAEIYLNIYRNYQGIYDDKGMCEVLFNTAINMEAARLVMPAIRVRQKMIELYPDCEHAKKAAYYIGQNYHALQVFNLASEHYLSFAERYPGEEEAPDAVANAVLFNIGMGKYDESWSAVRLFERLYRNVKPEKTAMVFHSAGYIFLNDAKDSRRTEVWESVRDHYKRYLRVYTKVKAIDEQVQAMVFIGDSFWNQRPRELDKAVKHYTKALALFDDGAMDKVAENARKGKMLVAAAKARYRIAERKYHEFRRIKFPEFTPGRKVPEHIQKWYDKKIGKEEVERIRQARKYRRLLVNWGEMDRDEASKETRTENANVQFEHWLEKRFKPWMDKKMAALKTANEAFAAVVKMHVPEWEMAASARAGDMQLSFMNALYDAPLPPMFKNDEELTTIYRQSMDEKAQPFRDVAIKLFDHCLNVSTKLRWFNNNSRRCEAELSKLDPRKYPVSEEIRIQPNNEIHSWALPGPILDFNKKKTNEEGIKLEAPGEGATSQDPPPPEKETSQAPESKTAQPS